MHTHLGRTLLVSAALTAACATTTTDHTHQAAAPPTAQPAKAGADLAAARLRQDTEPLAGRMHMLAGQSPLEGVDRDARLATVPARLAPALRTTAAALSPLVLRRVMDLTEGGSVVQWHAEVDGLRVLDSDLRVVLDTEDRPLAFSVGGAFDAGLPHGSRLPDPAVLTPRDAVAEAALEVWGLVPDGLAAPIARDGGWSALAQEGRPGELALTMPAHVREVLVAEDGTWRRAYDVVLTSEDDPEVDPMWRVQVDANDGHVIAAASQTSHAAFDYRVWAEPTGDHRPLIAPTVDPWPHASGVPDGLSPAIAPSTVVTMDGFNTAPGGGSDPWIDAGATALAGNNVVAQSSPAPSTLAPTPIATTGPQAFDYVYDFGSFPLDDVDQQSAGTVMAFYTVNWLHDAWYDAGFDEAAGTGQTSNYGRGGVEGDAMALFNHYAYDEGQRDNARMETPPDGVPPRMTVYVWDYAAASVDTAGVGSATSVGTANFGPQDFDLTAELALPGANVDGCLGVDPTVAGKIAVIARGSCTFVQKVENAEAAGAVGVLITNNTGTNETQGMTGTSSTALPTLMTSQSWGDVLRAEIAGGPVVSTMFRTFDEKDGGLEGALVAHEWGHYLLGRLLDGCLTFECGGLNEGHADFVALHLGLQETDDRDGVYPMAPWVADGPIADAYFAIRRVPYSRDRSVNDLSYRHLDQDEPLPTTHPVNGSGNGSPYVHAVGEIYASTMFDAYLALLDDGPNAGRTFAESQHRMAELVVGGLSAAPSHTGFLGMRDALLAVAAAGRPADAVLLADAFAARGMGSCATAAELGTFGLDGIVEDTTSGPNVRLGQDARLVLTSECDADGLLDAGETGEIRVTVENLAPVTATDVSAHLTLPSELAHVTALLGDTVVLPPLAPFATAEVIFPIGIPRTHGGAAAGTVTLDLSGTDVCADVASRELSFVTDADTTPSAATVDVMAIDDGTWTADGVDANDDDASDFVQHLAGATLSEGLWFLENASTYTDLTLTSPPIQVEPGAIFRMVLTHRYEFELEFDGGRIELSVDGGPWQDASTWASPAYDATLTGQSVLAGLPAYTGASPAWPNMANESLDFGTALGGSTVRLRFRVASDFNTSDHGWEIDTIALYGTAAPPFSAATADTSPCNQPPVADAGPDQTVTAGDLVTLDGSGSSDPNGDPLSWSWTEITDLTGAFPASGVSPSFTAPQVASTTDVVVGMRASDGAGYSEDTVKVTVLPNCVGDPTTGDEDLDLRCDDIDQCIGVDLFGDADLDGICTGQLTTGAMIPGSTMTLLVEGTVPGSRVFVFGSTRPLGSGPCHPDYPGTCLDLRNPFVLANGTSVSGGTAILSTPVPASVPSGATLRLQAVWWVPGTPWAEVTNVSVEVAP